ncbi:DUF4865 family protein [Klebsiella sp. WOUb02]|uniref:DUF4865 family protein n=1 Tax=Klebsiella sp. WOUb02 TaxID=3161071 RepID=UPI003CF81141
MFYCRRDDRAAPVAENRYAPLYVWQNAEAMTRFLQSPGFTRLCEDFGWPRIESWLALRVPAIGEVMDKSWLSVEKRAIAPFSDLASLDLQGPLCAWDLSRWQTAGGQLWRCAVGDRRELSYRLRCARRSVKKPIR